MKNNETTGVMAEMSWLFFNYALNDRLFILG